MENENKLIEDEVDVCGIIMPIANTAPYKDGHWNDVYSVLCEVASGVNLKPNLVSFDDDVTILHKRIIRNIYFNPIVICDISSRNPNVMFELGMRLAFDKPTVIIKDDITLNSFDIASIEYLEYPSDLRYQSILSFKEKLKIKINETLKRAHEDDNYSTFLGNFGDFKTAKLVEKEVPVSEFLLDEIRDLKGAIKTLVKNSGPSHRNSPDNESSSYSTYIYNIPCTTKNISKISKHLSTTPFKVSTIIPDNEGKTKIIFEGHVSTSDAIQLNSVILPLCNE